VRARTAAVFAIGALGAAAASASEVALPAPGGPAWQPLEFSKIPRHTRYELVDAGGALRADSQCAASGLLLPLDAVDLRATPRLRWRWKVEKPIGATLDERSKSGDDFAARVYVAFAFEPERAGVWERARRRLGAALYGEDLPGSALNYVWSRGEFGAEAPVPLFLALMTDTDGTCAEARAFYADFRLLAREACAE
jgi:hypothetical protein